MSSSDSKGIAVGDALPSQSTNNNQRALLIECTCVLKIPQHKSPAISRCGCNTDIQVACFVNQYKQSGKDRPKNIHEWLHEFITFSDMYYYCSTCKQMPHVRTYGNFTVP